MDKILEKFGIYDLIVVLLPGISISVFSVLVLQVCYKISLDITLQNETMSFLVISYFVGLVFQELGSLVQQIITHKNSKLLKMALKTSVNSHILLTEIEKRAVWSYVVKKLHLDASEDNNAAVYSYCKAYILEHEDTLRIDKDWSLSAMSRSFALYFTLFAMIMFVNAIVVFDSVKIILMTISLILAALFYHRWIRFAKLRYLYIFHTFYYKVIKK